jgi:hypothetical protein
VLQSGLSDSGDQVAQRSATRPNDVMLEQPRVCGAAQGFGARRGPGNAGEVLKQLLPLGTIAAQVAEVRRE